MILEVECPKLCSQKSQVQVQRKKTMFRLTGKQEELLPLHPFILHSPSTEGLMPSYIKANYYLYQSGKFKCYFHQ